MADELLRARRKRTAILRAERALKVRLEAIDWELDHLQPELEELENAAAVGILPEFKVDNS